MTKFTIAQISELVRCKTDIVYFINNYVKVVNASNGLIPLRLHDGQERFIRTLASDNNVLSMMSRQCGNTTLHLAYLLHVMVFESYKDIGLVAHTSAASKELLNRLYEMYVALPEWMKIPMTTNNMNTKSWANGNTAITISSDGINARGRALSVVYIDGINFFSEQNITTVIVGMAPVLAPHGRLLAGGVPNTKNKNSRFEKMWDQAKIAELSDEWHTLEFDHPAWFGLVPHTGNTVRYIGLWDRIQLPNAKLEYDTPTHAIRAKSEMSSEDWDAEYGCKFPKK